MFRLSNGVVAFAILLTIACAKTSAIINTFSLDIDGTTVEDEHTEYWDYETRHSMSVNCSATVGSDWWDDLQLYWVVENLPPGVYINNYTEHTHNYYDNSVTVSLSLHLSREDGYFDTTEFTCYLNDPDGSTYTTQFTHQRFSISVLSGLTLSAHECSEPETLNPPVLTVPSDSFVDICCTPYAFDFKLKDHRWTVHWTGNLSESFSYDSTVQGEKVLLLVDGVSQGQYQCSAQNLITSNQLTVQVDGYYYLYYVYSYGINREILGAIGVIALLVVTFLILGVCLTCCCKAAVKARNAGGPKRECPFKRLGGHPKPVEDRIPVISEMEQDNFSIGTPEKVAPDSQA